jgi:hypothetical protein
MKMFKNLRPLYTRIQDHESPGPKNSTLNLLLNLRMYFIKVHLGPWKRIWFEQLYGAFCWDRIKNKKNWRQNGAM